LVFTPCDGTFSKRFKFKKCPSSSHQTYFSVMKEGVQASDFCHNFFSFTAQKQCTARLVGEVKGVVYDSVEAQQPRFRDQACLLYHFIASDARNPGRTALFCVACSCIWCISAMYQCANVHTNVNMLSESLHNYAAGNISLTTRCNNFCRRVWCRRDLLVLHSAHPLSPRNGAHRRTGRHIREYKASERSRVLARKNILLLLATRYSIAWQTTRTSSRTYHLISCRALMMAHSEGNRRCAGAAQRRHLEIHLTTAVLLSLLCWLALDAGARLPAAPARCCFAATGGLGCIGPRCRRMVWVMIMEYAETSRKEGPIYTSEQTTWQIL
jgi:hypothetical protein